MTVELYFAPGACSFVPHVGLEIVKAATGRDYTPKLVKLHKGEHLTPEYKALNPDAQVPLVVVDGKPLTQIVAICDWIDRANPEAKLLPTDPWSRAFSTAWAIMRPPADISSFADNWSRLNGVISGRSINPTAPWGLLGIRGSTRTVQSFHGRKMRRPLRCLH